MKKKVSVYFALLIMLSGFINGPLATYVNATTNEPQTEHVVKESDVTKDASTSTGSSNNNEKKESTTNTPEKKSDDPELSEIKSRAPSEVNLNKVIEESSKKNLGTTAIATFDAVQTTSSKAHDDVITSFTITDKDGKPITSSIDKLVNFKVNGTFKLPNGEVSEGDTTTIQLPPELIFGLTSNFDLKDSSGNVVAHAVIDPSTKMVVLTYTDYVEKNSDISGSFFFYAKIDSSVVKQEQNVPIDITIGKDTVLHAGDIGYIVYKPLGSDLDKYGTFTSNNLIEYRVSVNRSKKDFNKTIVSDSLSTLGTTIVDGSFKIKKGDFSIDSANNWFLKNPSDVTSNYTIQLDADKRGFSIDFGDIKSTDGFFISYQVKSSYELVDGEKVTNNAKLTSSNTVVSNVTKNTAYYEAGGSAQGATFKISLHKSNEDGQSLSGAKFEVIRDRNQQSMGIITSDEQGNASIGSLLKDSYTIKEIQAPYGYDISSDPINVTPADFNESKEAFKEIINKKSAPATTEVKGTKTWDDANNQDGKRPASITVNLLADGKQVASTEVTADQNWQYTFSNLPKFADGKEIVYTVTENQVVDYTTEVKGFDITNSYTPGKTSVSVTKSWDDANNQDGLRPESIKVQLLADGQKQGDIVELNSANKWTTTWHDLNQKSAGKDIVYTVEEVKVADYTTTVDATDPGNIKLTNTHAPATTEVKGTKTWDDANNQDGKRPASITVNLLADGKQVASTEVTADQNWQYTFSNLPKFADGKEIVYTVTENQVVDYTTEVKGFDITNTYKPKGTLFSNILPSTGEYQSVIWIALGVIFLTLGAILLHRKRNITTNK